MSTANQPHTDPSDPFIQQLLLGEAIDGAAALVFVADEEMRYLAVNDGACATLGYTREELLRLRVPDIVVTEEAPELYGAMVQLGKHHGSVVLRRRDGGELRFRYRASQVTVSTFTYYVSVGFVED